MIITSKNNYKELDAWLSERKKVLFVCDEAVRFLDKFNEKIKEINIPLVRFSNFKPNPDYESVVEGVQLFRESGCEAIMAVGGGSAIDVAKCIKLYSGCKGNGENGDWLKEEILPNSIPFLAMPTTAGTGSEATRYAVIYYNDKKQSITSESIIPETVLHDPDVLRTLPVYQKKATMMDALSHAIESFWSVNSNEESKKYSKDAITGIMTNMDGYLANTEAGNAGMLLAAYTAGKAINITQTTAGHAMCYKITSLFGCAHGHAAALCNRVMFPWMIKNVDRCTDIRGAGYLKDTLNEIGIAMGCEDAVSGANRFVSIFDSLGLDVPAATKEQFMILKENVNVERLRNHPVSLDSEIIDELYHQILKEQA